jgi:hypothetical protein
MRIKNLNHTHTTNEVAQCLRLIREQGPIKAIGIADRLGLAGNRETKRRHVRAIVQHLRNECGEMIVADGWGGYFLTDDEKIWQLYLKDRSSDAKKVLGQAYKKLKMVSDLKGQGLLFLPGQGRLDNSQFSQGSYCHG